MRRAGIRGAVGLLVLLLVILAIGIGEVYKGSYDLRVAEETSEDDGDSDYGPTEMA
jgi:hypothetical protein